MLNLENEVNPNENKKSSVQIWEKIANEYCKSSDDILNKAIEIKKLGINSNDALHIACANSSNCDYFITCDKGILKKNLENITIINPIDFIRSVDYENR